MIYTKFINNRSSLISNTYKFTLNHKILKPDNRVICIFVCVMCKHLFYMFNTHTHTNTDTHTQV